MRSLYKSDSSILHQLGLATAREQQPSNVEVASHTHFLPIPSVDETSASSLTEGTAIVTTAAPEPTAGDHKDVQRVPTPTGPVPEVCPVLGRESSYQLYQDAVDDRQVPKESCVFIPRFQVQKTREKCCQTGDKSKSNTPEYVRRKLECVAEESAVEEVAAPENIPEERSPKEAPLGMFLFDMKDVLELSTEEAERFAMEDAENYGFFQGDDSGVVDYSSDYESMGGEQASMEDLGKAGIAELWEESEEESEDQEEGPTTPVQPQSPTCGVPCGSGGSTSHYRSIWSCGTDQGLPSLPNSYNAPGAGPFGGLESHPGGSTNVHLSWSTVGDELNASNDSVTPTAGAGECGGGGDTEWPPEADDVFADDGDFTIEVSAPISVFKVYFFSYKICDIM